MIEDLLQEAYNAMRHNRRRTALTMLGMAWGIATVVMLLAYGDGFGRACAAIFANFGTKLVDRGSGRTSHAGGWSKIRGRSPLYPGRRGPLTTNLPQITHITPEVGKQANVQYDTAFSAGPSAETIPTCSDIRALKLRSGTLLQPGRPGAARPGRGDRLGSKDQTVLRTQCALEQHIRSTASASRWSEF